MDTLELALKFTLPHEGGYCNDPLDRGGETNKGIIKKVYDKYRTDHGLPIQSVKLISDAEVYDIYKNQYFLASGAEIFAAPMAIALFDASVNCGVSKALKWLNQTKDPTEYIALRRAFYHAIVEHNPQQVKFLKGWLKRVDDLEEYIKKLS